MNGAIRSSFRLPNSSLLGILSKNVKNEYNSSRLFSMLKNISFRSSVNSIPKSIILSNSYNNNKNYSNESNDVAVQLEKFLEQEISEEKKLLGSKTIPSKIDDFEVKLDGSDVTLIKTTLQETIEISFNINASIESNDEEYAENIQTVNEPPELRSKPDFDIKIKRGDTTLEFNCEYVEGNLEGGNELGDEPEDVFVIDMVTLYIGEWADKAYCVSGQILDGYLYDLLMNLLDSKGITNDFVMKMSDLSTAYEQSSYISLLKALKEFASK